MRIGIQASHEQFSPSYLLKLAVSAEAAGFDFMMASDHIAPWSRVQGDSGFVWSWLGAALEKTSLEYGVVTVPGYRYHPVVLAQSIATLCDMYPGRFMPCLGSGEALNEHVVGTGWPEKSTRNQILEESVGVMRQLWRGETVTYHGKIHVDEAKLYTLPPEEPNVYGAALTQETAGWLASWADGMITVGSDINTLKQNLEAFRKSNDGLVIVKVDFAYGSTKDEALAGGYSQWRYQFLPTEKLAELRTPEEFEEHSSSVSLDDVEKQLRLITSLDELALMIEDYRKLGVDSIVLHNVALNQEAFIDDLMQSDYIKNLQ